MLLDEYQQWALRTCGDDINDLDLKTALEKAGVKKGDDLYSVIYHKIHQLTLAAGISGEGGEVADLLKKAIGHGHKTDPVKLKKELGDIMWYVAVLAEEIGFKLSEVAQTNVEKLKARYPEGFSSERSINRPAE